MTITISDSLIILATLLSPLIAVQVQKWIEQATERRDAQRKVFYDLMATRATRVAPKHVEALNSIDIEFNAKNRLDREVIHRWRNYADHLNTYYEDADEAAIRQWNIRGDDLFTDLLQALSTALGYAFDPAQLRRGIYYPRAHNQAEMRREIFEREILRLLLGQTSLNMKVTDFPVSDEAIELQKATQEAIIGALKDGTLKVKQI